MIIFHIGRTTSQTELSCSLTEAMQTNGAHMIFLAGSTRCRSLRYATTRAAKKFCIQHHVAMSCVRLTETAQKSQNIDYLTADRGTGTP